MSARHSQISVQSRQPVRASLPAPPSASRSPWLLAAGAGIADCTIVFSYILAGDPTVYAAIGIALKALLVPFMQLRRNSLLGVTFVLLLTVIVLTSQLASPYQTDDSYLQIGAFSISLLLSVLVVSDRVRLEAYSRAFVNTVCATALLYLVLVIAGQIPAFSRATYFSGSHPNLGSEINAMAAMMACIFFRGRGLGVRVAILFVPVLLMQGRAAMLTIMIAVMIAYMKDFMVVMRRYPAAVFPALLLAVGLGTAIAVGYVEQLAQVVFLTDDPYRGQGTGLVGRTDRWQIGIDLFLERPLVGNGASAFEALGIDRSHSFFLYGLANLGLLFFIVLGMMIYHGMRLWKRDRRAAWILSSLLVMLVLNDRFLNLNPYPFQVFVMLLGFSMLPEPGVQGGTLPRNVAEPLREARARRNSVAR